MKSTQITKLAKVVSKLDAMILEATVVYKEILGDEMEKADQVEQVINSAKESGSMTQSDLDQVQQLMKERNEINSDRVDVERFVDSLRSARKGIFG